MITVMKEIGGGGGGGEGERGGVGSVASSWINTRQGHL